MGRIAVIGALVAFLSTPCTVYAQTYTMTTKPAIVSGFGFDGKYSNQPLGITKIAATTTQTNNVHTGQPLQSGSMNGDVFYRLELEMEADPDGRPLNGSTTAYGGNGVPCFVWTPGNAFYSSGDTDFDSMTPFNIGDGLAMSSTTWGGQFLLCYGMFASANTYGAGNWRSDITRYHQAVNSGSIRIICKQSGAYINADVYAYPFAGSNPSATIHDVSNYAAGVTWHDLPGGNSQPFYIPQFSKTFYLNVPINGYTVYTISDGVSDGGVTPGITASPSTVPMSNQVLITLTGTGTNWTASTNFGVSGVVNCGLRGVSYRSSDYQTVTLICYPGDAAGTLTFGEGADSYQATVQVTNPNAPTPSPSPSATPSPAPSPSPSASPSPSGSPSPSPSPAPCSATDTSAACQQTSDNFWTQLFVPTKTHFSDFDSLRQQFASWGPGGYFTSFLSAWNTPGTYCTDCSCGPSFDLGFDFGTYGHVASILSLACTSAKSSMAGPGQGSAWGDLIATIRPFLGYAVDVFGVIGLLKLLWPRNKA